MEHTYLIQRLERPRRPSAGALGGKAFVPNPFSFGGGGSGLSREAMEMLSHVFEFDYMGAAEYEFGAAQRALHRIATDRGNFISFTMEIPLSSVAKHWREQVAMRTKAGRPRKKKLPTAEEPKFKDPAIIYVFCHKDERTMVENTIHQVAMNKLDLKRGANLHSSIRPMEEFETRVCGWLELNNGYFFFTDEEMWKKTVALFKGDSDGNIRSTDDSKRVQVEGGAGKDSL